MAELHGWAKGGALPSEAYNIMTQRCISYWLIGALEPGALDMKGISLWKGWFLRGTPKKKKTIKPPGPKRPI